MIELTHVRAEINAGRMLSEQEQRAVRTRLKAQATQIEGLENRVTAVEKRTERRIDRFPKFAHPVLIPDAPQLP